MQRLYQRVKLVNILFCPLFIETFLLIHINYVHLCKFRIQIKNLLGLLYGVYPSLSLGLERESGARITESN